jgi:hypothetical protein
MVILAARFLIRARVFVPPMTLFASPFAAPGFVSLNPGCKKGEAERRETHFV